MSIEARFDISFVARMAIREKQIQQNFRPIIAVHKWFARRPGTLFRALLLSEFADKDLRASFFESHNFEGKRIADPFMGGGTPLVEANRIGFDVDGVDINPMSAWVVNEEIAHINHEIYDEAARKLLNALRSALAGMYVTDCTIYGDTNVPVKYFIWVKEIDCDSCANPVALFPSYQLAEDARHPRNVLICANCGDLNEVVSIGVATNCKSCDQPLIVEGFARKGRCKCRLCGHENRYPRPALGPPRHRLVAIEYYNPIRKDKHQGRFFKKPDARDFERVIEASRRLAATEQTCIPSDDILPGDETKRLHKWGYKQYRQLFNDRQLLGLQLSAQLIQGEQNKRIRHALATNLSDLLRYQNMLCRYDSMALKSLDVFSVHGFPIGLVQCESNLLGISGREGVNVGSGGWTNIIDKYSKAKRYCDEPFEIAQQGRRNVRVVIPDEWIGERRDGFRSRTVNIHCASSTEVELPSKSLDAVLTDPPYFGNVQYAELMDFCYVWLRHLVGTTPEGFERPSTRAGGELTGNVTEGRGIEHFAEGITSVFRRMQDALKTDAPLVFTFHHNRIEPYAAAAVAILDSGFTCTASIPCPAEMGGSIHIHGTASSIFDTVFVCRGRESKTLHELRSDTVSDAVLHDVEALGAAGISVTLGDARCITFGHAVRFAIGDLEKSWISAAPTSEKLANVENVLRRNDLESIALAAVESRKVLGQIEFALDAVEFPS